MPSLISSFIGSQIANLLDQTMVNLVPICSVLGVFEKVCRGMTPDPLVDSGTGARATAQVG